ncbi:hypothetical protein [Paenibacillus arenosi]|uniref:Uncharacterized protein n=1 Tax=Paenibacillus arenosi TaxID=2774142 RepID=A0ABR9AVT3_9BACL|nr:hypothetical protein [Paenibacillus arenosi]MBD8498242.1 hypothetical protein [Paenibacillus arenosi]
MNIVVYTYNCILLAEISGLIGNRNEWLKRNAEWEKPRLLWGVNRK